MVEFSNSVTKDNLMRAFAGESQARNRYTFAASQAKKNGLQVISAVFAFTASQEKEHAEIFYKHLQKMAGSTIFIDGGYPVDISDNIADLLDMAQHNEYEEHDSVYQSFGDAARKEGFDQIAASFFQIAAIEKVHGDRFGRYAKLIREGKLNGFSGSTQKPAISAAASKPASSAAAAQSTTNSSIQKGCLVKITGSKYYSGVAIPAWVKAKNWYVSEVSGSRAVINKSEDGKHAINSPVNVADIALVSAASASGTPNAAAWTPAVGDKVRYNGTVHYTNANAARGASCKGGIAEITQIYQLGKSKHPYHLVHKEKGCTVYGWVDAGSFTKA